MCPPAVQREEEYNSMNTLLKRKVQNILEFSSMRAFSDLEISSAANPANQWILLNVYVYKIHQSQKNQKRERRKREEKRDCID